MLPVQRLQSVIPASHTFISHQYRQALEPFVDPEQLELSDHKPPVLHAAVPTKPVSAAATKSYTEVVFVGLLTVMLCVLGTASWKLNFAELIPHASVTEVAK